MKKLLLLVVFACGFVVPAHAYPQVGHFKLSLWDQAAVAIPHTYIQNIEGADLGIGSHTQSMTGFQWDLMWAESHYLTGVSGAFGISKTTQAKGLQWAFVTMSEDMTGVQLGGVNMATTTTGVQLGGVNMSHRSIVGAQVGFYNQAEYINGVQFGLVNYAKYIYGLQLGIFNIAENGYLPAMVFINGRF